MTLLQRLLNLNALARLRDGDATLFSADPAEQQIARESLGFTTLALDALDHLETLAEFVEEVRAEGTTDVVLLGMGGSSLAALVLVRAIGHAPGWPTLHVLDTTSPDTVVALRDTLDPEKTLWLVSSKSGGTIEPNSLYAIFRARADAALGHERAGGRFVAITDPGSPLVSLAEKDGFRRTFLTKPTVGGRYSALTLFGLVPAALAGLDIPALVGRATRAERLVATIPAASNDAAALASIIGGAQASGVDKLTIITSPRLASFGLWIEQLVAESLGKHGVGVVPVVELASAPPPHAYGEDRLLAVIALEGDEVLSAWAGPAALERPLFSFVLDDPYELAAQFVTWEWAVALLGVLMGVNPFGQPDVATAKAATERVLAGELDVARAQVEVAGSSVTFGGALAAPTRQPTSLAEVLSPVVSGLCPGDYLALLAFVPDDPALWEALAGATATLSAATGHAVTLELGPRYLHSTGQLHKGGRDNGAFVVVTAPPGQDSTVPGRSWTLGELHRAQAEGDFATLAERGRRVVRIDLPDGSAESVDGLADALLEVAFRS